MEASVKGRSKIMEGRERKRNDQRWIEELDVEGQDERKSSWRI